MKDVDVENVDQVIASVHDSISVPKDYSWKVQFEDDNDNVKLHLGHDGGVNSTGFEHASNLGTDQYLACASYHEADDDVAIRVEDGNAPVVVRYYVVSHCNVV